MSNYWNSKIKVRLHPKRRKTAKKGKKIRYLIHQKKLSKKDLKELSKSPQKLRSEQEKRLDELISEKVKRLANGKCVKCGLIKKRMGVSHFFPRWKMGTRWLLANLVWSCWHCHTMGRRCLEHEKYEGGYYHNLMIKKLGKQNFQRLKIKSEAITKFTLTDLGFLEMQFIKGDFN